MEFPPMVSKGVFRIRGMGLCGERFFFWELDLSEIIYHQLGHQREGHPGPEAYEIWHCKFIDIRKYHP